MNGLSPYSLFSRKPVFAFMPSFTTCPKCHEKLKVSKTRRRTVVTMSMGAIIAYEKHLCCKSCQELYTSEVLGKIVPAHCTFGYDVLVHVGKSLFLYHRNSREVCQELTPRGIKISPREVDYLGQRFIIFLALAHRKCSPRIREFMQDKGGYIFHLDGTCDGSSPHLMSGLDSISEIVLANTKLATENSDQIIPFLQDRVQKVFGDPIAVVTDMGAGILKAVEHVFEGIIHLICHFHFLRDIGRDLLQTDYEMVRQRLKKHKIVAKLKKRARMFEKAMDNQPNVVNAFVDGLDHKQLSESMAPDAMVACAYSLIEWALAGKKQGQGYGFPFDRVHVDFTQRLYNLQAYLKRFERASFQDRNVLRPFNQLMGDLVDLIDDAKLKKAMREIDGKIQVFEALRTAMRIAPTDGKQGLNFNGTDVNLKTIEKRVTRFCKHLKSDRDRYDREEYQKMIGQIEKYWDKLFADPITVQTNKGKVTIVPQRTNNIMEQLFRDHKKSHCRKTGNSRMDKALQTVLADTPLIKNLENDQYMNILLDGKSNLEEVFAEIDIKMVRNELAKAQQDFNKIPVKLRKIISHAQLPEMVAEMLKVPEMANAS